jgi:ribosomal protein S18 acetylase RimI-like enzyme
MTASRSPQPSDLLTAEDVRLMQGMAQRIVAVRPDLINADASFGELAWIWGKDHAAHGEVWPRRLWFADGELVAWGWAFLPHQVRLSDGSVKDVTGASAIFQVHPDQAEVLDELIAWFEDLVPDLERHVIAQYQDKPTLDRWVASGYQAAGPEEGRWTRLNERSLSVIEAPALPEGFRFRTAAEVGPEAAARAHLDAWHPSKYSLESYQGIQRTATYRDDLHIVIEAPDGTMAASAIMWLDELNQTVEFEPVGTHRDFRQLGLGQATMLHGMHVARAAGATHATVACAGAPGNPALRLYESVGFREFTRDIELRKPSSVFARPVASGG